LSRHRRRIESCPPGDESTPRGRRFIEGVAGGLGESIKQTLIAAITAKAVAGSEYAPAAAGSPDMGAATDEPGAR
jgi:hypothetical protein